MTGQQMQMFGSNQTQTPLEVPTNFGVQNGLEVKAFVKYIIYRQADGFTVLKTDIVDESTKAIIPEITITIKDGTDIEPNKSTRYVFIGQWTEHEKYGRQFTAEYYYEEIPNNELGIQQYLIDYIYGIGEKTAKSIIKKFGTDVSRIIEEEPERLLEVKGISEAKLPKIIQSWKDKHEYRLVTMWLAEKGISPTYTRRILEYFGNDAIAQLTLKPYELVNIDGIGFLTADRIAHLILPIVEPVGRMAACVAYLLTETQMKDGNVCLPVDILVERAVPLLQWTPEKIKNTLQQVLIADNEEDQKYTIAMSNNVYYVYLRHIRKRELFVAEELVKHVKGIPNERLCISMEQINAYAEKFNVRLDDTQKMAVYQALHNRISIITGSGGSGKTTITKLIADIVADRTGSRSDVVLITPTGKAAQVLADKTKFPASTVHRTLEIRPGSKDYLEIFGTLVGLDETSMVGLDVMYLVMQALQNNKHMHFVIIGDPQQLPSISAGNILTDLLASGVIPTTKLEKIYRQSADSVIPEFAKSVSEGRIPSEIRGTHRDFEFIECDTEAEIVHSIEKIIKEHTNNAVDNLNNLQVLSAMYRGAAGVIDLNKMIQSFALNFHPSNKSAPIERGANKFYVGDRVMQLENDYKRNVFNGDVGTVKSLNVDAKMLEISLYDGRTIIYEKDHLEDLMLAWSATVHKFQGSQTPIVIIPIYKGQMPLLSREWLYTAITRASEKVYMVGQIGAMGIACNKSAIKKRYTLLVEAMQSALKQYE